MGSATATSTAATQTARARLARIMWPRVVARGILYLVLITGAAIFMFPLFWLVATSLKPERDVFLFPPNLIPTKFEWVNYPEALAQFPFLRSFLNTMIIVIGVEIGRLLSCSLAAYGFARLRFPFRDQLFIVVLCTMMLPYQVTLLPQYLVFRDFGWLDTFLPLTVPSFFATNAFFIFMLRQFFRTIPTEYDDAAEIDGCSPLGIYWHIILPMSLPALGAVAIFTFMGEWNDYFAPLIYLNTPENHTLAIALNSWQQAHHSNPTNRPRPYSQIMAVATLITLVPVIVFFLAQRYFIQGVVITGVKG